MSQKPSRSPLRTHIELIHQVVGKINDWRTELRVLPEPYLSDIVAELRDLTDELGEHTEYVRPKDIGVHIRPKDIAAIAGRHNENEPSSVGAIGEFVHTVRFRIMKFLAERGNEPATMAELVAATRATQGAVATIIYKRPDEQFEAMDPEPGQKKQWRLSMKGLEVYHSNAGGPEEAEANDELI